MWGSLLSGWFVVNFGQFLVRISGQDGGPHIKKVQIGRIFKCSFYSCVRWRSSKWGQANQCWKLHLTRTVVNVNTIVYGKSFGSAVPIGKHRIWRFFTIQRPWTPDDGTNQHFSCCESNHWCVSEEFGGTISCRRIIWWKYTPLYSVRGGWTGEYICVLCLDARMNRQQQKECIVYHCGTLLTAEECFHENGLWWQYCGGQPSLQGHNFFYCTEHSHWGPWSQPGQESLHIAKQVFQLSSPCDQ